MKGYIITAFLLSALFYSCKKIVTLKLNTAPSQIVIQGAVTNAAGPYTVAINQSVGFYADNSFPPVSGAIVVISDDQGVADSLTETSPGIYSSHVLQGQPGHGYTLNVFTQNKNYTAFSFMPQPVLLDSVTFKSSSGFGQHQIDAVVNFQDPAGLQNDYQFEEYINGTLFTKNFFVFSDRLSDEKYLSLSLRTDSNYLNQGDQVDVKMYCIDSSAYNYLFQLDQTTGGGTFNTNASPANPSTNISNGALGYFSAQTTQFKTAVVP